MVTKVLYVEDNEDDVYMLKMRLELLGDFEVLTAQNGQKGCEIAVGERPDIIIMDLEMPILDGWEATRWLKSNRKRATPRSSLYRRTRWPTSGKRHLRRVATRLMRSRFSLSVC